MSQTQAKTIEQTTNNKIEQITSNKIEQIESKQKEIAINQIVYTPYFKSYLGNIQIPSLNTPFSKHTANQISILVMNQSTDTNHTRMEHLLLSARTTGSKYLAIGSARLRDKLIAEANQSSASIDRWVHGDWYLYLGSQKSGNKMSVDFGRNTDDKIGMEPSRTIRRPHPQITRTRPRNCNISDLVSRVSPWHVKMKSGSENLV